MNIFQMNNLAEILEEELEAEAQDPCNGKTCTANEHCCDGHVCVDTDESKYSQKQQSMKKKTPKDKSIYDGFLCTMIQGR